MVPTSKQIVQDTVAQSFAVTAQEKSQPQNNVYLKLHGHQHQHVARFVPATFRCSNTTQLEGYKASTVLEQQLMTSHQQSVMACSPINAKEQ